jgi:UDP-glucose 4-epimerase
MKVLITGGAGFIGSTIARRFVRAGHEVVAFDNMETGDRTNLPAEVALVEGDVRDLAALTEAARGAEVIVHQAAMVSVARSVSEPALCWEVNVTGTQHALEAACRVGARRVLLASSAAVYGNAPGLPKREEMAPDWASPYAYSKWLNECDAGYYARYHGLETVCLRYFNVFGPRQRPDSPYSGVISIAAAKLLAGEPFTVNGTGEQSRDFVFSEDVAGAVLAGATAPGVSHAVLNVGRGERTSLLALLEAMGQAIGREPVLRFGPPRAGDVMHSQADVSRLAETLGFRARTPLVEGLARTLAWMRERGHAPV